ncbi:hypothetical protein [Pandoraea terrigena]|uniref:3'-5' exonuclease n=1 Tax=Pandoraea terrigena TaxID=2508292 RepID=A0A5E4V3G9_9BURK|nr:hypothetical protein [Pandoraea terrigena]VVE06787.1 3'-5' exonuclease [Pandoraea terrigena]
MNIYIDIETVPSQDPAVIAAFEDDAEQAKATVCAPSNYKDETKIAEYIAAKRAEIDLEIEMKWRKTSFDGGLGHIVCASIALDDAEPMSFWRPEWHANEAAVMRDMFDCLSDAYTPSTDRRPVFIGHYVTEFDLRFIFQRAVMLGIRPPSIIPFSAKPWDDSVFDTMTRWAGTRGTIGLDKLCRAFGLPEKGDIDGSKVWDFVRAGRLDEVVAYCEDDVRRVRGIHKRMTFQQAA